VTNLAHTGKHAPLTPTEPQSFSAEGDRARLSGPALRAYRNLVKHWKLTNAEAAALLAMSESSWDRIKRGQEPALNQDQLTRISAAIGIFKGLHLLFADSMADDWVKLPNKGPLFDRRSPVDAMIEGGIPAMLDARRYIDAIRGGI